MQPATHKRMAGCIRLQYRRSSRLKQWRLHATSLVVTVWISQHLLSQSIMRSRWSCVLLIGCSNHFRKKWVIFSRGNDLNELIGYFAQNVRCRNKNNLNHSLDINRISSFTVTIMKPNYFLPKTSQLKVTIKVVRRSTQRKVWSIFEKSLKRQYQGGQKHTI